jgi:hypothetical protein
MTAPLGGGSRLPEVEPPAATPSKVTSKTVLVILLVVGGACILGVGVFGALAMFGVRRYISSAKAAEGQTLVRTLADGMVRCAAGRGSDGQARGLPESSVAVPSSLSAVRAKKYQSSASEWHDPAFDCAGFRVTEPQYFQYRWVRRSATSGAAVAVADLDGDGVAELSFEQSVSCDAAGACRSDAVGSASP